jgi:hypothetical protein
MPSELRIDSRGLDELSNLFAEMEGRVVDWSDAGDGVGTIVRDDFRLKFLSSPSTEVGGNIWGGEYWRPLENGYLKSRPDRRTGQVLIDTGETMKAFTTENYDGNITDIGEGEMTFGADLDHLERLEKTWKIAFWHPALLDRVSRYLANFFLSGDPNALNP